MRTTVNSGSITSGLAVVALLAASLKELFVLWIRGTSCGSVLSLSQIQSALTNLHRWMVSGKVDTLQAADAIAVPTRARRVWGIRPLDWRLSRTLSRRKLALYPRFRTASAVTDSNRRLARIPPTIRTIIKPMNSANHPQCCSGCRSTRRKLRP